GRGLRLVYGAGGGFTADELAACAAVGVRLREPIAGVEVLTRTRHPRYPRPGDPDAGPVQAGVPACGVRPPAAWLGREADEDAVNDWLAEHGLERGRRYAHDRCPLDPGTPSHGEPVLIGDDGVFCFKCEAGGLELGGRKPGWFPWASLACGGYPARL